MTGLLAAIDAHPHDPGITGIVINALGKLAANAENHRVLVEAGVVKAALRCCEKFDALGDARFAEGFAALILPLSFDQELVRTVLGPAGAARAVIKIAKNFGNHSTTVAGSPMSWPPPNVPTHNAAMAALASTFDGPDAEERAKSLPRIAQTCAQVLANLACDNEMGDDGKSSVDVLVDAGAIAVLADLIVAHPENPRLLEDCICGLSNMAYVSEDIQLQIGRSSMRGIAGACARALKLSDACVQCVLFSAV